MDVARRGNIVVVFNDLGLYGHTGLGIHDLRHDHADFPGRVEFPGGLARAFGEFADQVFVAAADDVRLHIVQTQPLLGDFLDQAGKAVVGDVALAVGGGVEVHPVNNPLQQRVGFGDPAQMGGKPLADLVCQAADHRPDLRLRVVRLQRQVEAHQLVVPGNQSEGPFARTDALGNPVHFVVEHIAQPLGEDQRQDEVFVFGRFLRPADAASRVPDPGFKRLIRSCLAGHWLARFPLSQTVGRACAAGFRRVSADFTGSHTRIVPAYGRRRERGALPNGTCA